MTTDPLHGYDPSDIVVGPGQTLADAAAAESADIQATNDRDALRDLAVDCDRAIEGLSLLHPGSHARALAILRRLDAASDEAWTRPRAEIDAEAATLTAPTRIATGRDEAGNETFEWRGPGTGGCVTRARTMTARGDESVARRALRAAISPFGSLSPSVIDPVIAWVRRPGFDTGSAVLSAVMVPDDESCDSACGIEMCGHFHTGISATIVTPTSATGIRVDRLLRYRSDEGQFVVTVDFGPAGSELRSTQICEFDPRQVDDDGERVDWPAIPWVTSPVAPLTPLTTSGISTGPARAIASEVRRAHARGFADDAAATRIYLALAEVSDDVVRAECMEAARMIAARVDTYTCDPDSEDRARSRSLVSRGAP